MVIFNSYVSLPEGMPLLALNLFKPVDINSYGFRTHLSKIYGHTHTCINIYIYIYYYIDFYNYIYHIQPTIYYYISIYATIRNATPRNAAAAFSVRCGWRWQRDADGRWTQGQQRSLTRCRAAKVAGKCAN